MNDDPTLLLSDSNNPRQAQRRWLMAVAAAVVVLAVVLGWWFAHHRASAQDQSAGADAKTDARPDASADAGGGRQRSGGGGRGARGTNQPPSVGVATVTTQDIHVTQNALGTVTPLATVTLQAQASGVITKVAFVEGQTVKQGDFLIEIDPRPYQAALDQAQGQLVKDQAALEEARMDLVRYEDLLQKKSIQRQQAEDQKWVVVQDEGAVQMDKAAVATAQINLGYTRIVSPTDGRIGLRLVDPGNVVQAGSASTSLAVITRMQPMTVVFALPEDNLPVVFARQKSGAKLPVQAFDRAGVRLLDTGVLSAIDSQINTSTGTVNLKATFPNASGTLFPNQFVNVVLRVDDLKDAVAVPTAAIQRGSNDTFVYVLKADSTVAVIPVKLGPSDGGVAAALSGLKAGDRVVVDGTDKLRDGMQVNVPKGT